MNIRQIKPVKIWVNGVTTSANRLKLYNYGGYNFATAEGSYASYQLGITTTVINADETVTETFQSYAEGSVVLPSSLVESWGDDDEPIWQYVLSALNLTEVTE